MDSTSAPNEKMPQEALQLFQRGRSLLEASPSRTEEAIECFEDAAQCCRRAGADYSYGTMLNNIGYLYANSSDYLNANEHYRRALEVLEAKWPDSRETANTLHNLGDAALRSPGMHMLALRYFKQALAIDVKLNPSSAECGRDMDGIAAAFELDGDLPQAVEHYVRAMETQSWALPRDAFKKYLLHLAELCRRMGHVQQAETYQQRANGVS